MRRTPGRGIWESGSPFSFLGLPKTEESFHRSKGVVVPVPYDGTTTYQSGTREGPRALIAASRELEYFDEETLTEPYREGIFTLNEVEPIIRSPEEMLVKVEQTVGDVLDVGKFPLMVGGEHLLTLGAVRALSSRIGEGWGILHLDAHADLRAEYQGSAVSNACVMRLALSYAPVVSIGIRSLTKEEYDVARHLNSALFFCHELKRDPTLWERVIAALPPKLYVTVDLDVFDSSIMPAVGTPEPGGLDWYEVTGLLRRVFLAREIIGCDIMELKPLAGMVAPDFLAAKLAYKVFAYLFAGRRVRDELGER